MVVREHHGVIRGSGTSQDLRTRGKEKRIRDLQRVGRTISVMAKGEAKARKEVTRAKHIMKDGAQEAQQSVGINTCGPSAGANIVKVTRSAIKEARPRALEPAKECPPSKARLRTRRLVQDLRKQ